jgi:hypothetical protein
MGHIIIGLIGLAIIYGLIVSRGFRIFLGLVVVGVVIWFAVANDRAEKRRVADGAATVAKQAKEKIRQAELWSKVSPALVELRNPQLAPDGTMDFQLTGSIKNLSDQSLSGFEIEVTARDCTNKCETIGHSTDVLWTDVPPHEVRGVSGRITMISLPQLRGKFVPQFAVKQVYAGDFLDQWSAR